VAERVDQSRRHFLKRAGGVAFAAPVIVTMMSRSVNAAHTQCGTVSSVNLAGLGTCTVTAACHTAQTCGPPIGQIAQVGDPCTCVGV